MPLNNKIKIQIRNDILEFLVLLAVFAGVFEIKYYNRFYPNIFIGNLEVAGKNYGEVLKIFKNVQNQIGQDGFKLVFLRNGNSKEITVPTASYGLTSDAVVEYYNLADAEDVIQKAFNLGRQGSVFKRFREQLVLIFKKRFFQFPNFLQEDAVRSLLSRELNNFYVQSAPARFSVDKSGIRIIPETAGEQFDNYGNKIIRLFSQALANLNPEVLFFTYKPSLPMVTEEKLSSFLNLAEEISQKTEIRFVYGDYQWPVAGSNLISWTTLNKNDELAIDPKSLDSFLTKNIRPLVYNPPQNSRFEIRNGKLAEILKGWPGNNIDYAEIEKTINEKLRKDQENFLFRDQDKDFALKKIMMEIPIKTIREFPKITKETVNQYEIKELVAQVKTSFKGSTGGRRHNIQTGIERLNGVLIAPWEEFSAVEAIGLTREEDGFVKEFVIKGDRSVKESGGGLCQIATTLFRLAINSGLPITARTNHLYVVSYYGPGLDATIYGPQKDLKFINDTGHWLLLQAKISGDEVWMEFYGNKDGREIAISEPKLSDRIPPPEPKYVLSPDLAKGTEKCTEQARFGITSEVAYAVKYLNGKTNQQNFKSIYQPWQKVCLVGAATAI